MSVDRAVEEAEAGSPTESIQATAAASATRWRRDRPVYLLLALLLLIGWEATATVYQRFAAPTEADWQRAAKLLGEQRKQGGGDREPLLFAPLWVEPLGRYHFRRMVDLELSTLSDVDRFERIWQVSIRGARHPWLAGKQPSRVWEAGRVKLSLFASSRPAKVLYDFHDQLGRATVDRAGPSPARCRRTMIPRARRRPGPRFVCDARRRWNWVGWHLAEVGHRPYRCIFAHPVDNHRMRIAYDDVPLGDQLVVYTGIDDFENRKKAQGKVVLQVFIDDQRVATVDHQNAWPWHRSEIDTAGHAGKRGKVRFEISTSVAYARAFCFTGDTRHRSSTSGSSPTGRAR